MKLVETSESDLLRLMTILTIKESCYKTSNDLTGD